MRFEAIPRQRRNDDEIDIEVEVDTPKVREKPLERVRLKSSSEIRERAVRRVRQLEQQIEETQHQEERSKVKMREFKRQRVH